MIGGLSRASVAGLGAGSLLVVAAVVADHAFAVQVVGAAAGAVMTTGGAALAVSSWPRRRDSEVQNLLVVGSGFFLACLGVFAMVAAVGIYH